MFIIDDKYKKTPLKIVEFFVAHSVNTIIFIIIQHVTNYAQVHLLSQMVYYRSFVPNTPKILRLFGDPEGAKCQLL